MRMPATLCFCLLLLSGCAPRVTRATVQGNHTVTSPDGRLVVWFRLDEAGAPRYRVQLGGTPVMEESRLGLVRDDANFSTALRLREVSAVAAVTDRYEILTAKRRQNVYRGNRRVYQLETGSGNRMDVVFQVSNDGVAFRYAFPDTSATQRQVLEEVTS